MKLLWITERFEPDIGGVARSAGRIVRSLSALGVSVDVVTWSRYLQPGEILPPKSFPTDTHLPVQVHRMGLYRHWDMTFPHTLNLLDWLHARHQYDLVWGHYLFPAGFIAAWFAKLNGLPSVVSARGNDIDRGMFPPGDFARLQWTLANAGQITAVSAEMAKKVEALSQCVVSVLPNAVDGQIFRQREGFESAQYTELQALRASLGILPAERVLGFSGELREKKGQQFLLQALSEVRGQSAGSGELQTVAASQRPVCLLVIGELRPQSQALLQGFAAAHPEDAARVIVTGHLAEPERVAQHLQLCDVYLQPSLWEGMPNALIEAMACECLCIGSDAGGIPEVIEHGVTGFIVGRSQLHHLGQAVLEALALDPSVRREIGKRARAHVTANFTLVKEQARLQDLLASLLLASL